MTNLLILGGYTPGEEPTSFSVTQKDTYALENTMEDGTTFIERSRPGVYKIDVGYTNIKQKTLDGILGAIAELEIYVQFYFGEMKGANMRVKDKSISLKSLINGEGRWNLSFDLEEF